MKKMTKQRRRTLKRKERQRAADERSQARLNDWLKTPEGRRAKKLRDEAALELYARLVG